MATDGNSTTPPFILDTATVGLDKPDETTGYVCRSSARADQWAASVGNNTVYGYISVVADSSARGRGSVSAELEQTRAGRIAPAGFDGGRGSGRTTGRAPRAAYKSSSDLAVKQCVMDLDKFPISTTWSRNQWRPASTMHGGTKRQIITRGPRRGCQGLTLCAAALWCYVRSVSKTSIVLFCWVLLGV